jgi:dTDP-4-dehydrorhamnose reductase
VEKSGKELKILLLGANGQLGRCLQEEVLEYNYELIALSHSDLDIFDYPKLFSFVEKHSPDVVINAAAYTNVPGAETDQSLALSTNSYGALNLASVCRNTQSKLIHISTNFVFDGYSQELQATSAMANPINFYGISKLLGERSSIAYYPEGTFILRTSSLFSEYGKNFIHKVLYKLQNTESSIEIVSDQYGQPTYARDLAKQIFAVIEGKHSPGIYHFVNNGRASWFELAVRLTKMTGFDPSRLVPVVSGVFDDGVRRPVSALLEPSKLNSNNPIDRDWALSLGECLARFK